MEFGQYCTEHGVEWHLTVRYSPQQNGVMEQCNQTIVAMVRCMVKSKDI
jgi:transposase InsO family protein